ncbi:unnamed protein product [Gadus morhua 'NCC']
MQAARRGSLLPTLSRTAKADREGTELSFQALTGSYQLEWLMIYGCSGEDPSVLPTHPETDTAPRHSTQTHAYVMSPARHGNQYRGPQHECDTGAPQLQEFILNIN